MFGFFILIPYFFPVLSKVLPFFQSYFVLNQSRFHASPSAMQDTVAQGLCRTGWGIDYIVLSLPFSTSNNQSVFALRATPNTARISNIQGRTLPPTFLRRDTAVGR